MDDSDSIFSDNSDAETFTDEFLNNIPEDSDEEECSIETIDNSSDDLTLEVGMTFLLGNLHMTILKDGHSNKAFFIRQGRCVKGVNHLTSSGVHHLVILLKNGIYKCSCMSLVTRGIVCRHYFSIMLRTSQAQFHIGFINSHWFITTHLNDIKDRPLYSASKFNTNLETSLLESNNSLEFLGVIDDVSSTLISTSYVSFNKQRLYYANVYGLVKQANQIACKTCDESFVDLLKEYINKKNSEALTLERSDNMENQDELEVIQN
ncbi:hypothetical protein C1646_745455 [Rhizophagus diaphanus]|nr:hypothetical protein C1646_745455 [Rhizophagus diaphanus] [Rhizophagus sp. MUCL 43196]